jgi:hypothetical protein
VALQNHISSITLQQSFQVFALLE